MTRRVSYEPDGRPRRAAPAEVAALWLRATTRVPPQYAVATAQHESDFAVNEVDVEPDGFASRGIYQVSDDEAASVGLPGADLLDLAVATIVMARLAERRLAAILRAANIEEPTPDAWAYLTIAHNQGAGAAVRSIARHGLDWAAYKARNAACADEDKRAWFGRVFAYGDNAISGGPRWKEIP